VSAGSAPCPGCGGLVPDVDGPTHAYIAASPGCWRACGELQASEYERFGYPPTHRLVVDAYAAQHPGDGSDRRDRQSVFVHLVGLCAVLERGVYPPQATGLLRRALRAFDDYPVLERTRGPGELTLLHVAGAAELEDYERRAREWAQAVWDAWSDHHARIRAALDPVL
jgi:hypothetical protein